MALPDTRKIDLYNLTQFKLCCLQYFRFYNRKFFKNRLPEPTFTNKSYKSDSKWEYLGGFVRYYIGESGRGRYLLMGINPMLGLNPKKWQNTFLHEMCHIADKALSNKTWVPMDDAFTGGHGTTWRYWMKRVGLDPDDNQYMKISDLQSDEVVEHKEYYAKHGSGLNDVERMTTCFAVSFIYNTSGRSITTLLDNRNFSTTSVKHLSSVVNGVGIKTPKYWYFVTPELKLLRFDTRIEAEEQLLPILEDKDSKTVKLRELIADRFNTVFSRVSDADDYLASALNDSSFLGRLREPIIQILDDE